MHTTSAAVRTGGFFSWLRASLRSAEGWLDSKGRAAWIVAMVLGFVFFWPLGLFLVFYITWTHRWSNDMFGHSHRARREMNREFGHGRGCGWGRGHHAVYRDTGNSTFDTYKAETLRRLEEEQEAFESFLQRLREAKDKQEFDSFMEDRARASREADAAAPEAPDADTGPRRGEY
jgi:hypothetical protein